MDLVEYLRAVRQYWWAVVLLTAAGLALGILAVREEPDRYRASVTFFVVTRAEESVASAVQGDQFAQRRVNSYVELLQSDRLAERIADRPEILLEPGRIRTLITGTADLDTVLLRAHATSTSRNRSLAIAGAIAEEFPRLVSDLESSGGGVSSVNLEVVSGPGVRTLPSGARATFVLRTGLGMILGIGAALLLHLRDRTVRREEQIEEIGAGPLLGVIPYDPAAKEAPLALEEGADPRRAERFRHLRTNLEFLAVNHAVQVLVVTSSVAGEGKSFVAINLGQVLAAAGREVVVVEADLRRPTLGEYVSLRSMHGLSEAIVGRVPLDEVVVPSHIHPRLHVIGSGELPPNPAELLGGAASAALLEELRARFDVVILNTPPVLPVTDGAVLAALADGVMLVVRAGHTHRPQVARAISTLQGVGASLLGTVLNMVPMRDVASYGGYDRYEADQPAGRAAPRQAQRS